MENRHKKSPENRAFDVQLGAVETHLIYTENTRKAAACVNSARNLMRKKTTRYTDGVPRILVIHGYRHPVEKERGMPIRPERDKLYIGGSSKSKEWKAFRQFLLERAGDKCEGTPMFPNCLAVNKEPHPETGSKVVLTIAHMDHDETHADPDRCRALCQRCHLSWDAKHHAKNAALTRRRKAPQIDIEDWMGA